MKIKETHVRSFRNHIPAPQKTKRVDFSHQITPLVLRQRSFSSAWILGYCRRRTDVHIFEKIVQLLELALGLNASLAGEPAPYVFGVGVSLSLGFRLRDRFGDRVGYALDFCAGPAGLLQNACAAATASGSSVR